MERRSDFGGIETFLFYFKPNIKYSAKYLKQKIILTTYIY